MNQTIKAAKNANITLVNGKLIVEVGPDGKAHIIVSDGSLKLEVEVRAKP